MRTAALFLLILLALATPARGERAFRVTFEEDVPILLTGLSLSMTSYFRGDLAPAFCAPLCDDGELNALDRRFAGRYHAGWNTAGDVALWSMLAGTTGLLLATEDSVSDALLDGLVIAEAVVWTKGIQMIAAYAAGRPRPYLYGEEAPLDVRMSGNGSLSLLSGHTTYAFAIASATWVTATRVDPDLAWPVGLTGGALATFVGASRVAAGRHFPTDVVMGAVFGTGMGLLLPGLHERIGPIDVVPSVDSQSASLQLRTLF